MRLPSASRIRTWFLARIERLWSQLAPRRQASEIAAVAMDAVRSRRELVLENAVLRHQVNVLRRGCKRPRLDVVDRLKLLLGARWLPSWRRVIVLVQPETVLRWHRAGFRRFWRRRSRSRKTSPLPRATIELIRDMAARGRLVGCRAHPRRAAKAGDQGQQADDPEVHVRRSRQTRWRPELGNLRKEPRRADVGLRFHPDPRSLVPASLRILHPPRGVAAGGPRRRNAPPTQAW